MAGQPWSDAEMLFVLDGFEQGLSGGEIAAQLRVHFGTKRPRGAVLAVKKRATDAVIALPCACAKPANRDGGMPGRWWAAGLARRAGR